MLEILLSESQIKDRVSELAHLINADLSPQPLTVVGVLTGALIFLADLVRHINHPHKIVLIEASSYRGTTTVAGQLVLGSTDRLTECQGRDVLLIDDILDTGHTIHNIYQSCLTAGARSVKTVVLLHKKSRQVVPFTPDYVGFTIPNRFVVGYGLDYNDDYRHLPFIATLPDPVAS